VVWMNGILTETMKRFDLRQYHIRQIREGVRSTDLSEISDDDLETLSRILGPKRSLLDNKNQVPSSPALIQKMIDTLSPDQYYRYVKKVNK